MGDAERDGRISSTATATRLRNTYHFLSTALAQHPLVSDTMLGAHEDGEKAATDLTLSTATVGLKVTASHEKSGDAGIEKGLVKLSFNRSKTRSVENTITLVFNSRCAGSVTEAGDAAEKNGIVTRTDCEEPAGGVLLTPTSTEFTLMKTLGVKTQFRACCSIELGCIAPTLAAARAIFLGQSQHLEGCILMSFKKSGFVAAAVFCFGLIGQAAASAVFTVNPNAIPGHVFTQPGAFAATSISGTSSTLLHLDSINNVVTGNGWMQLSSFSNGLTGVSPQASGLSLDYGLFLTFQLTTQLVAGTLGQANSAYNVTSFNFQLYADPSVTGLTTGDTYALANAATGTEAVITDVGNDDILLAMGSLITGVASFNDQGQASLSVVEAFGVCTGPGTADVGGTVVPSPACTSGTGNSFWDLPNAFYVFANLTFENTAQITGNNGGLISIQNSGGRLDFANATSNTVPEPCTLALTLFALVGVGISGRRKRSFGDFA